MPVWYKGISQEHLSVRNSVGVFDVTHMGRVVVEGSDAEAFLNFVTTNDAASLQPLSAHYSLMCNNEGGIKDDFVLSRLDEERFLMVYNAGNRAKNFRWLTEQGEAFNVKVEDVSGTVAMFAVQGPKAEETLQKISSTELNRIKRFKCGWTSLENIKASVSRTGYTGEDGFEVFIWDTPLATPSKALEVWNSILEAGSELGIEPCGLGARDTLRLEAGMCLYGNDIDENITPLEARLRFVVKFKKENFVGKEALLKQKDAGVSKKRVAIKMVGRGVPRKDFQVLKEGRKIGVVTSGTFSPLLKQGIAMAYVSSEDAVEGNVVNLEIRGKHVEGEIVRAPFYDQNIYGYKRQPQGK